MDGIDPTEEEYEVQASDPLTEPMYPSVEALDVAVNSYNKERGGELDMWAEATGLSPADFADLQYQLLEQRDNPEEAPYVDDGGMLGRAVDRAGERFDEAVPEEFGITAETEREVREFLGDGPLSRHLSTLVTAGADVGMTALELMEIAARTGTGFASSIIDDTFEETTKTRGSSEDDLAMLADTIGLVTGSGITTARAGRLRKSKGGEDQPYVSQKEGGPEVSPEIKDVLTEDAEAPFIRVGDVDIDTVKLNEQLREALHERRDPAEILSELPLNTDRLLMDGGEEYVLDELIKVITDDAVVSAWDDVQTFQQVEAMADQLSMNPKSLQELMLQRAGESKFWPAEMVATRSLMLAISKRMSNLAFVPMTDKVFGEIQNLGRANVNLVNNFVQARAGHARATASGRIQATGSAGKVLDDFMNDPPNLGTKKDVERWTNAVRAANGNPHAVGRLLNAVREKGAWNISNEMMINGLLSGPKTHLVNLYSNAMEVMLLPAESIIGGALTGNMDAVSSGVRRYVGTVTALKDATRLAVRTMLTEKPQLDPYHGFSELADSRVIRATPGAGPVARPVINSIGNTIRIPSRFLMTSDEFFKQIHYRSYLFDQYSNAAAKEGASLRDQLAIGMKAQDGDLDPKTGLPTNKAALQYAREATFTQDLRPGTLGHKVQETVNEMPWLRSILPFVKTPTNIIRHNFERTPGIGLLYKHQMRALKGNDSRARSDVIGKQAIGSMFMATAVYMAQSGDIVGGGPVDPVANKKWRRNGIKPYSRRVVQEDGTVKYVPFDRLDPRFMIWGIAADFHALSGQMSEMEMGELSTAAVLAVSQNLTSKTYLQGMSDALEAVGGRREWSTRQFAGNLINARVPYSSAFRQANQDPYTREVRTLMDQIMSNYPGWSETLDPVRNIFGEPIPPVAGVGLDRINPFYGTAYENDIVQEHLMRQGRGFTEPAKKTSAGLDLTTIKVSQNQTAYDRYRELIGQVKVGGKTLKEKFTEIALDTEWVNSDGVRKNEGAKYILQPDEVLWANINDGKLSMAQAMMIEYNLYKTLAFNQLKEEVPSIGGAEVQMIDAMGSDVVAPTDLDKYLPVDRR